MNNWLKVASAAVAMLAIPVLGSAQERLEVGTFPQIDDKSPTVWAMSGYEILTLRASEGTETPIMRSEVFDARLVEILSRTQSPPLRAGDIKEMIVGDHHYIVVRDFLLLEVMPKDAMADHSTIGELTRKWIHNARYVLPKVCPSPSMFGI